ncbi:MAG: alanine dehydrogenase [Alphaproteobacteria bacterium]
MLIGCPKEIKNHEYRVGLTVGSAAEYIHQGHKVMMETSAGLGVGYSDDDYKAVGCDIVATADEVFQKADMVVKVKEPQPNETEKLQIGQILYTYLHLAADEKLTKALLQSKAVAIAYETVTDKYHRLPLLAPMSEVAGRMAIQVAAHCLEKRQGGSGVLLGGVSGVLPAKVSVIGGGVSGTAAARMAMGLGADVTIFDKNAERLSYLDDIFGPRLKTAYSTKGGLEQAVKDSDVVIGAVLIPGTKAPKLVTKAMLKTMRKGSVLVDIAIDQGGCFETSKPTSHQDPIYEVDGIIHYCVTNIPGAVAKTSAHALNNATLPFGLAIANKGWKKAMEDDEHLLHGLNLCEGKVTYQAIADQFGLPMVDPKSLF